MINDYLTQHNFFVRRIMTGVMFTLWCLVSIMAGWRLLINQVALPEGFRDYYVTLSSAATIAIAFYYKGRNGVIKEKKEKIEDEQL